MASAPHAATARATPATAAIAASQEADDDVEEGDDAADDGVQDVADAVDDGHDDAADRAEDGLDLFCVCALC